jgi:hypothetical protein
MSPIPPLTAKPGYRPQAEDTSVESDLVQFYLLRQRTIAQRLAMAIKLTRGAKSLSLLGVKRVRSKDGAEEVRRVFARAVLGEKWIPELTPSLDNEQMWIQDSAELARQLHPLLESLNIPYYITGGVASIAHGEPRTTRDLDLVVQINRSDITRLVAALEQAGFYCPPGAVEDIQAGRGRVLSITNIETILNADIVVNADAAFDQSKLARRQLVSFDEQETLRFWLASPEDVILSKLLWGRRSQSEKQWRDVLGVLKVQGETLEFDYLFKWAKELEISNDLAQALIEAGLS